MKIFLLIISLSCVGTHVYANVLINQLGYFNNSSKVVYVTEQADSFFVVENNSGNIFYRGSLSLSASNDPGTGLTIYSGDFSDLTTSGKYYIRTNLGDSSFAFNISDTVFNAGYKMVQKAFYFQRCGTPLYQQYAGIYKHNICHNADAYYHSTTGLTGKKVTTGGWHDAGDFGKYIVNAGITVGTLLMAYEQFPERFKADDLNIPESGNSIPDLLDEVKYELEWFLNMQDSSGGVYFKVTRENFSGFVMPNTDNEKRYIYQISTTATGDFAAVMAMAARIYQPFNSSFSDKCLNASKKAWDYLQSDPFIEPSGGFRNPTGTATGEYWDGYDSDERLWAASELFVTTGNAIYHDYFSNNYSNDGLISSMYWGSVKTLGLLDYLNSNQTGSSSTIKSDIKNSLMSYCSSLYDASLKSGLRTINKPGEYNWGSNSGDLNNAVILLFGYQQSKNKSYYTTALEQLDYILGVNGNNISYVTGLGTKRVMHPHHRQSGADGITEPVPGLMAGGPNQNLDDAVLQSHFTSSTPPALCYSDDQESYASNEIAINWNAPLVFVMGYFNYEGTITGLNEKSIKVPNNIKLYQNYPNPFNPITKIEWQSPVDGFQTLKIYDVLGNKIVTLVNEYRAAGKYEINFNGSNLPAGSQSLPSGVYFYQLKVGSFVQAKKMILLK